MKNERRTNRAAQSRSSKKMLQTMVKTMIQMNKPIPRVVVSAMAACSLCASAMGKEKGLGGSCKRVHGIADRTSAEERTPVSNEVR